MSTISIDIAKNYLDVIHSGDDAKLQMLLDGAEDEAMQFMNRTDLTEWDSDLVIASEYSMPPGVMVGIVLLLQASYQAGIDEIEPLRKAAETKLMPFRISMGI